jgi:hypothetical protein
MRIPYKSIRITDEQTSTSSYRLARGTLMETSVKTTYDLQSIQDHVFEVGIPAILMQGGHTMCCDGLWPILRFVGWCLPILSLAGLVALGVAVSNGAYPVDWAMKYFPLYGGLALAAILLLAVLWRYYQSCLDGFDILIHRDAKRKCNLPDEGKVKVVLATQWDAFRGQLQ